MQHKFCELHNTLRSKTEDCPRIAAPARVGCPVVISIIRKDQPGVRISAIRTIAVSAKAIQRGNAAARGHLEDRAPVVGPAQFGCAVKVAIAGLDHRSQRNLAIRYVEDVQQCEGACGGDLESGASIVATGGSAGGCRPIKVAITALYHRRVRIAAVVPSEAMQHGECATRGDSEDRAATVGSADRCRSV